jgi:hypothetical protein
MTSLSTRPFPVPSAGSKPSNLPGAPPLPDISRLDPRKYPPLDKPPPSDSPEVIEWINEILARDVNIPDIPVTQPGLCGNPANLDAAHDVSRSWWTCSGRNQDDADITDCPNANTWGLTYDDGPGYYTPNLLEYLDAHNLKATFFVIGSRALSFPRLLQYEYLSGHQIAVHTWSHTALTTQTNNEVVAELGWTRKIIQDVLGVTPNMMRPPFGDIEYVLNLPVVRYSQR